MQLTLPLKLIVHQSLYKLYICTLYGRNGSSARPLGSELLASATIAGVGVAGGSTRGGLSTSADLAALPSPLGGGMWPSKQRIRRMPLALCRPLF